MAAPRTPQASLPTTSIDWILFSIYVGLMAIGWMMIYSVNLDAEIPFNFFDNQTSIIEKQSIFIGISLLMMPAILVIDINAWRGLSYPLYALALVLLIAVLFFGALVKGNRSWFHLGGFSLQPSEFAKFATCLAMSSVLSAPGMSIKQARGRLYAFGVFLLPMGLILLQPDAGSALVFLSFTIVLFREGINPLYYIILISLASLFITGYVFAPTNVTVALAFVASGLLIVDFRRKLNYFIGLLVVGGICVASFYYNLPIVAYVLSGSFLVLVSILFMQIPKDKVKRRSKYTAIMGLLAVATLFTFSTTYAVDNFLKPHQQERIKVWLRPQECNPRGSLYNVLQSKLAIGSGSWIGKGFTQGTMTKLNYVPEQSTDFIFCTIGEEQGFIGTVGVIILFLFLLLRIITIAERQNFPFVRHYAYCVAGVIFVHFTVNIGMTMGLLPVIGVPLPFVSYGGSSLLAFTLMIGVLLRLDTRNK
jgi:rod shape determining protein RodA